jgi:hypothetical protein
MRVISAIFLLLSIVMIASCAHKKSIYFESAMEYDNKGNSLEVMQSACNIHDDKYKEEKIKLIKKHYKDAIENLENNFDYILSKIAKEDDRPKHTSDLGPHAYKQDTQKYLYNNPNTIIQKYNKIMSCLRVNNINTEKTINFDHKFNQYIDTYKNSLIQNINKANSKETLSDIKYDIEHYSSVNKKIDNNIINMYLSKCMSYNDFDSIMYIIKKHNNYSKKKILKYIINNHGQIEESKSTIKCIKIYEDLCKIFDNKEIKELKNNFINKNCENIYILTPINKTNQIIIEDDEEFIKGISEKVNDSNKLLNAIYKGDQYWNLCYSKDIFSDMLNNNIDLPKDVSYVASTRIRSLRINRRGPYRSTKTYNAFNTGLSYIALGLAYGSGLKHFEYTEVSESIKGGLQGEIILYDVTEEKIKEKDKFSFVYKDDVEWAENVLACVQGPFSMIKKQANSLIPDEISHKLNNNRSIDSEEDVVKELRDDLSRHIHDFVISNI